MATCIEVDKQQPNVQTYTLLTVTLTYIGKSAWGEGEKIGKRLVLGLAPSSHIVPYVVFQLVFLNHYDFCCRLTHFYVVLGLSFELVFSPNILHKIP